MKKDWNPSEKYLKIVLANQKFYAKTAYSYERTETCVLSRKANKMVEKDLSMLLTKLGYPKKQNILALDCCGGTGNIALKLLARGISCTLCDISPEMLLIFRTKCDMYGYTCDAILEEIGRYLVAAGPKYDLIIFSSALHHLEDVIGILKLAASRLAPGGLIYTVFDSTIRPRLAELILLFDQAIFKLIYLPEDLLLALGRRWRRWYRHNVLKQNLYLSDDTIGVLAEYHQAGIDDTALINELRNNSINIIQHVRQAGGRFAITQILLKTFGYNASFKLVLGNGE